MIKKITLATLFLIPSFTLGGPFGSTTRRFLLEALRQKAVEATLKQRGQVAQLVYQTNICNTNPRCVYGLPCICADLKSKMTADQIAEAQRITLKQDDDHFNID